MKVINETLLACVRLWPCAWCGADARRREPHHLFKRGHGGGRRLDIRVNLAALCALPCHDEAERGVIPPSSILAVVAGREGVDQDRIAEIVYAFRRLDKDATIPPELARFVDLELRIKPERGSAEWYTAQRIDPGFNFRAWRLWKASGGFYDLHEDEFGMHCTCWSGLKRENSAKRCKHCTCLFEAELGVTS